MVRSGFLCCLALSCLTSVWGLQPNVSDVQGFAKLRSWKNSTLYLVQAGSNYEFNPYLIHMVGSRYDMGYAYGYLLSEQIQYSYQALLQSLLGDKWYDVLLVDLLGEALDWQWNDYLSKQVPAQYLVELQGLSDGAAAQGCAPCGNYVTRAIVLANAPGDVQDFIFILLREYVPQPPSSPKKTVRQAPTKHGLQCSMFAVWGDRTQDNKLFSARNLDWNKDTGINKNKLVTVMVPNDGSNPSVQFGFVGLFGALAGMSSKGLTVHEANLEEDEISFSGFPWTLRLRYIMENAANINEAKQLWEATNNTVGFNHMVASGPDATAHAQGQTGPVALVMETMYQYTAYFADDDQREAAAVYTPSEGSPVHIGFPMKEALWRTNHGYDPRIMSNYEWSLSPTSWSVQRYMFIHEALQSYQNGNVLIGYMEAINITAIAGDKGNDPYTCKNNTDGSNVLSVTFQPQDKIAYVAWERSSGVNWRPATCSTYLKFDFTEWFQPVPPY